MGIFLPMRPCSKEYCIGEELDRVPLPSEKAIQNTLEISHRVAPKLSGIDIKRHLHFGPVQ